jgi:hypothetical protein
MKKLFTERQGKAKPRTGEALDVATRDALLTLIRARMDEEWFGLAFPDKCLDGYAYAGTDSIKLQRTMEGYGLLWPRQQFDEGNLPADGELFDLVEFAHEHVAEALNPKFHSYGSHSHYEYDQDSGRQRFADDVNRIFERNGMAFELIDGEVTRIAPPVIDDALARTLFHTGDAALDKLLETARHKFLNRDLEVRRESLEKLWDAWERLKTLEPGDKKASIKTLLDRVTAEPMLRAKLDQEARELTEIGNTFMIRHTERSKVPVTESAQVDCLFHRMFALILLALRATRRGG